jgi:hypothetical protein
MQRHSGLWAFGAIFAAPSRFARAVVHETVIVGIGMLL